MVAVAILACALIPLINLFSANIAMTANISHRAAAICMVNRILEEARYHRFTEGTYDIGTLLDEVRDFVENPSDDQVAYNPDLKMLIKKTYQNHKPESPFKVDNVTFMRWGVPHKRIENREMVESLENNDEIVSSLKKNLFYLEFPMPQEE